MTIRETLAEGKKLLEPPSPLSFIDTPALDAALLLGKVMRKSRAELITHEDAAVNETQREEFLNLITRRRNGECVAYILGRREFRGLEFAVNPQVLVPRPDTEILVEAALEYIDTNLPRRGAEAQREEERGEKIFTLLDLCTGSGAVAISLKNECPFLHVTASDISPEALETAALNASRLLDNGLNAVHFIQSDLFENISSGDGRLLQTAAGSGKFDLIVSNPPYVPTGELSGLAPEVRREPQLALDGGGDGLDLIRKIVSQAPRYLLPGGVLLLEAGSEQMPAIRDLLATNGFGDVRIYKDLAGRERVIGAER